MSRLVVLAALACALSASPALATWPHDPAVNVPVCTAASYQDYPSAVPDGAGGMIVTWYDYRSGTNYDVYAQRVDRDGNPLWTANGVLVYSTTHNEYPSAAVADGAGGAYIAIEMQYSSSDHDIVLSRIQANGTTAPGWPKTVNGATTDDINPAVASDGSGGVYIAWNHNYGSAPDIMATHFDGAGNVVSGWVSTGSVVCTGAWWKYLQAAIADGSGGLDVVWHDARTDGDDGYAQRLRANGTAMWTANGLKVLAAAGSQYLRDVIGDGSGGVYVADEDNRVGGSEIDVYLGHVVGDGTFPGGMSEYGAPVANASGTQTYPHLALDGSGGVYVGYYQVESGYDKPYVQRLTAGGALAPGWSSPLKLASDACDQSVGALVADGLGGVYALLDETCPAVEGIQACRILPGRALAPGWPYGGIPVTTAYAGLTEKRSALADDNHDLLVAWRDSRVSDGDIYAQKVDHNGVLGAPAPTIASVKDVRPDQGGHLRLAWNPGWPDNEVDRLVTSYSIWRQVPASLAQSASRARRTDGAGAPERPTIEAEATAAGTIYWEFVGSQAAAYTPGYSYIVPTLVDSVTGANPRTVVRVRALTASGAFWDTAPDSGYSVDDLAPATPTAFAGTWSPGTGALLMWGANGESDLAGYRLYRGFTPGFVPGPADLVAVRSDPGYLDAGAPPAYYRLSAVDVHGNESATALLLPSGTTDVGPGRSLVLALAPIAPNPARGTARLAWTQPLAARVTLAVFDTQGRCVRTLADGPREAGAWSATWEGRDAAGAPAGSGLYFARLTCGDRTLTRRFALVR